ncbi:MBL fold metallo-hydrolase [Bacillus suaedae]|uniref:MBL fold metallo-hydrolase n=1 Tax=Halalkalibacter suaedae TaxID=2822140 RepID=A0A940WYD7_9BACI|nr:MBL fold metallo-hydrolase [Bacillus suaedae]MBP3950820.1 MBL fold metallo-hydrolase [Bacillus suaedae]
MEESLENKMKIEWRDTKLPTNAVAFWSLGQASILLKGKDEDGFICIDPYLTNSIEKLDPNTEFVRAFQPLVKPKSLKDVDGMLITHDHGDHLDRETISKLAQVQSQITYVVPPENTNDLVEMGIEECKVVKAVNDQTINIKGFRITPISAAHTDYEYDSNGFDRYLGYFIEVNGVKLFHCGDTVITDRLIERAKAFQPDVSFLPINGRDYFRTARDIAGNMNFREAADFANVIKTNLIVPIHFDMFPNNRENPAYFVDYLFHTYPTQKHHMMVAGERFIYYK